MASCQRCNSRNVIVECGRPKRACPAEESADYLSYICHSFASDPRLGWAGRQGVVGGDEPFEAFMRQYFRDFANGNVSSEQFKEYFLKHFAGVAAVKDIDWDTWYYSPGAQPPMPC